MLISLLLKTLYFIYEINSKYLTKEKRIKQHQNASEINTTKPC